MNNSKMCVIILFEQNDLDLQSVTARVLQAFEVDMEVAVERATIRGADRHSKHAMRSQFYAALTERQRQIVRQVICGQSNKEIAFDLSIVPGVVAEYLSEIYARLDNAIPANGLQHSNRARLISFFGDYFESAV